MLQLFKNELNHTDITDDLTQEFISTYDPKDEEEVDIMDEEDYEIEQYEIEDEIDCGEGT